MSRFGDFLRRAAVVADKQLDRVPSVQWPGATPREERAVTIAAYRSYGTRAKLGVQARVIVDRGSTRAEGPGRPLENLAGVYRRFHSWEIPGARLRASFKGHDAELVTNAEGYAEGWLELPGEIAEPGWNDIELTIVTPERAAGVTETARVLVPHAGAEFGIISDLDDTVIATNATKRLAMLQSVLLHNAHSRMPWEGVDHFYRELSEGSDGERKNPIFYVSGGPWNLYDIYHDFLELQSIPPGPIELADFGFTSEIFLHPKHEEHKAARIGEILSTYPDLPFVLIGDSGEKDAEIYVQAAETHGGRIRVIYIRDVTPLVSRDKLDALTERARTLGTEMRLVRSTLEAWKDARTRGLVSG